jgi:guanylate kinase
MQGVKQIKTTDLNPMYVFIHPPSRDELERRLRGRNTETEESLQKRLAAADAEMAFGTEENFDMVVVNKDIDEVEKQLSDFLKPHIDLLDEENKSD